jgi:hypothetical protein
MMLKRTLMEINKGFVFRRFEHPTRGPVVTLTYPCGRVIYVAAGLEVSSSCTQRISKSGSGKRRERSYRYDK